MSARDPDWALIKRITRIVHNAPGGGIHRTELAERAGVPAYADWYSRALMIAYKYKRTDFCGQYVVKPARNNATQATNATQGETR